MPQSADIASDDLARPSSDPPISITLSSTIRAADIAIPVTSKILLTFLPQSEHGWLFKSNLQVVSLKSQVKVWLSTRNKFYLSLLVCINPKPLLFIIGNTDIDFLSSRLPTSPPIAPVLHVGLVSVGTEMTVACEIWLNLLAINLMLTFINSNLTADQVEDCVEGAINSLQHPASILTGSCLLQLSIFYFW